VYVCVSCVFVCVCVCVCVCVWYYSTICDVSLGVKVYRWRLHRFHPQYWGSCDVEVAVTLTHTHRAFLPQYPVPQVSYPSDFIIFSICLRRTPTLPPSNRPRHTASCRILVKCMSFLYDSLRHKVSPPTPHAEKDR
jgi:hypothetical protein